MSSSLGGPQGLPHASSIADVIRTMTSIQTALPDTDGLKWGAPADLGQIMPGLAVSVFCGKAPGVVSHAVRDPSSRVAIPRTLRFQESAKAAGNQDTGLTAMA